MATAMRTQTHRNSHPTINGYDRQPSTAEQLWAVQPRQWTAVSTIAMTTSCLYLQLATTTHTSPGLTSSVSAMYSLP